MQFKGLVRFFTVALIIVSLYQLHLTYVVRHHENKIKAKAEQTVKQDPSLPTPQHQRAAYKRVYQQLLNDSKHDIVTYGLGGSVTYDQAKEQELNLGLDLQGGMNVTLDISLVDLIRSMANDPRNAKLGKVLADAEAHRGTAGEDYASLFYESFTKLLPGEKLSQYFSNYARKHKKSIDDASILKFIREESNAALKRTYDILLTRIDQFGVAQPTINLDADKAIITVELAGNQEDPERIRKYLQATAKLQFWEVENCGVLLEPMVQAEKMLGAHLSSTQPQKPPPPKQRSSAQAPPQAKGKSKKSLADLVAADGKKTVADGSALGKNVFSVILSQLRYTINEAQQKNVSVSKVPFVFQLSLTDTAPFNRAMREDAIRGLFPADVTFLPAVRDANAPVTKEQNLTYYAIRSDGQTPAPIEGDDVVEATQDFDERGRAAIRMVMGRIGERKWAELTAANVGMPIAISLDDKIYSAPYVNSPITGGISQISGNFTVQEAQDLANILRSGKLPVPAKIVQEQIVGPTLGQEAIEGGAKAFLIAFLLIMFLMYAYYSTAGWVANIALVLNLLFTIGLLTALGATLTAPGIAGLVLTIGMAVDTNVIIFERIKEEIKRGNTYMQAVQIGYKRSLAPVLDAHVTTLLTAIILYNFGLGSIKGFATTQILGILLSLLCGILVSRQISDFWGKKNRTLRYFTAVGSRVFQHSDFKFIEFRKYAYVFSAIIVVVGVGTFFYGFDQGVEFKGGRSYTVRFDKVPEVGQVREALKAKFDGENPIIKTIGDAKTLNITTSYLINSHSRFTDSIVGARLYEGLRPYLPADLPLSTFERQYTVSSVTVGPTISSDLKKGALKATVLSLIAIFVYIFLRFRRWQYSLGTIIALFHDVLVILIVFSFLRKVVPFPLEIDQHFVAAVLTVIGFSMNDTVIVFDRIRETYRQLPPDTDDKFVINRAINDTLSRTVMTAFTIFITILVLFVFGGEVTRGFAFALLVGVLIGTYSSIFVAAPILVDFGRIGRRANPVIRPQKNHSPA